MVAVGTRIVGCFNLVVSENDIGTIFIDNSFQIEVSLKLEAIAEFPLIYGGGEIPSAEENIKLFLLY